MLEVNSGEVSARVLLLFPWVLHDRNSGLLRTRWKCGKLWRMLTLLENEDGYAESGHSVLFGQIEQAWSLKRSQWETSLCAVTKKIVALSRLQECTLLKERASETRTLDRWKGRCLVLVNEKNVTRYCDPCGALLFGLSGSMHFSLEVWHCCVQKHEFSACERQFQGYVFTYCSSLEWHFTSVKCKVWLWMWIFLMICWMLMVAQTRVFQMIKKNRFHNSDRLHFVLGPKQHWSIRHHNFSHSTMSNYFLFVMATEFLWFLFGDPYLAPLGIVQRITIARCVNLACAWRALNSCLVKKEVFPNYVRSHKSF